MRFSQGEPPTRIWLHLVNNCALAIRVNTSGVPDGSVQGEVGVLHEVVEEQPILTIYSDQDEHSPKKRDHVGKKPPGYDAELSSAATIAPGQSILFSIPTNHLSESWHIEIPITFVFGLSRSSHMRDESIGGEPIIRVRYSLFEAPNPLRQVYGLRACAVRCGHV